MIMLVHYRRRTYDVELAVTTEWRFEPCVRIFRCRATWVAPPPGTKVDGVSILVEPDHVLFPLIDGCRRQISTLEVGDDNHLVITYDFRFDIGGILGHPIYQSD
jgi:hypothetical protein